VPDGRKAASWLARRLAVAGLKFRYTSPNCSAYASASVWGNALPPGLAEGAGAVGVVVDPEMMAVTPR
jgi:hypothetical protein